jgi:CheY-like chemotaxis protein
MKPGDLNILLVEDNPEDVYFTRKVLKRNKLSGKIHLAKDGDEALKLLGKQASNGGLPDLILLDINLPGIGGIELLRRLKQDPRLASIPVIMLTCSNMGDDIQQSYDLGARTYLVKPISSEALALVLESMC